MLLLLLLVLLVLLGASLLLVLQLQVLPLPYQLGSCDSPGVDLFSEAGQLPSASELLLLLLVQNSEVVL